jgi:GNAT superfamily N-acetyltransferase
MTERSETTQEPAQIGSPANERTVRTVAVEAGDALVGQIIALADEDSSTLGFLPHSAFEAAARRGTLLAAVHGTDLVGYALFALPRQHVRLVHLCVAKRHRGRGIARLLVEEVSARHRDRLGIILRCRRDYPAHHMWPSLGFRPRHETRGRGRKETVLVVWWREHGHPDLFSIAESYAVLRVALDFNVFLDLHTPQPRSGSVDSLALTQDWLRDQVELVVTSEIYAEIDEAADQGERARLRGAAAGYTELRADARRVQDVADKLIARVRATHQIDLSKDSNDLHDVRHVAEASVAGMPVLATRDDRLVKLLSDAAIEIGGVLVLHPADVVVRLDELTRAQVYRPAYLLDTQYTVAAVASGDTSELEHVFLDRPRGERRSDFVARLRRLATSPQQWERNVVRDPAGQAAAIYAGGQDEVELTVPIIRISSSKLGATIARQLLLLLRQRCRALGLSRLRLTDPFTSEAVVTAALDDGFYQHGQDLLALVIDACAPAAAINDRLSQIGTVLAMKIPTIAPRPPASTAAALERTLWPVKIIDAELPTFLIPIRPVWSSQLFGVPASLLPRPALLGMSPEHVYYRSPTPKVETAPARVLWYASGKLGSRDRVGAVVACSRLEDITLDEPKTLYTRFRHLGVWEREQIQTAAGRRGVALALRFFDTELLPYPVPLRRLRQLAARHDLKLALRSPQRLPPELFATIYQEGQTR